MRCLCAACCLLCDGFLSGPECVVTGAGTGGGVWYQFHNGGIKVVYRHCVRGSILVDCEILLSPSDDQEGVTVGSL